MSVTLSKKLLKLVGRANARYRLINEGDKVLLGLSGGKDSLTLAHVLKHMHRHAPFNFEYKAVTVSYGMGENFDALKEHCLKYDIPYEVFETNIFEVGKEKIRENSSYCSFFSRMRRGALYSYALKHGYNKLALGHHLDDAAESFFMNFMYNGALRSLPAKYRAKNGLIVIRPLIFVRERQLLNAALENQFPIIGDEACPSMRFDVKMPYARAEAKRLLRELEAKNNKLFISLKAAFEHIHDDSFLDENRYKVSEE
ncbi:MAG: tRNA 2-thiocytidine biosynthesis protein TtcA [Epsilonproteobacteria bacterium]|nr:tRNA 2-thiocytidine biosynthesis protein TtcA [Campylobacterota bacterium]